MGKRKVKYSLGKGVFAGYGGGLCRSSSVAERVLGKDEAESSILSCGTTHSRGFGARPAFPRAALVCHISHVFVPRPGPQVRWVAAQRVVACVHNDLFRWDAAVGKFKRNPMRAHDFLPDLDLPVAFGGRAAPRPAHVFGSRCGRDINLCPKARNGGRGIVSHDSLLCRDVAVRGRAEAPTSSLPRPPYQENETGTTADCAPIGAAPHHFAVAQNSAGTRASARQKIGKVRSRVVRIGLGDAIEDRRA